MYNPNLIWFNLDATVGGYLDCNLLISLHVFEKDSSLALKDGMEERSYWDEMLEEVGLEGQGDNRWKVMGEHFIKKRQSNSIKNIHRRDWYTIDLCVKCRSEGKYKSLSVKTVNLSQ